MTKEELDYYLDKIYHLDFTAMMGENCQIILRTVFDFDLYKFYKLKLSEMTEIINLYLKNNNKNHFDVNVRYIETVQMESPSGQKKITFLAYLRIKDNWEIKKENRIDIIDEILNE